VKTVYIVMGRTGEYSDRREWPVRAFLKEIGAELLRNELLELTRAMGCGRGDEKARDFPMYYIEDIDTEAEYAHLREPWAKMKLLDPQFKVDYTGTDYTIWSVPLSEPGT
jgi:hypothetical protein